MLAQALSWEREQASSLEDPFCQPQLTFSKQPMVTNANLEMGLLTIRWIFVIIISFLVMPFPHYSTQDKTWNLI